MTISQAGLNQIKRHEGLRLNTYLDAVGVPTIGYGNTFYEDGKKVRMGERITMQRAESLLRHIVDNVFSSGVQSLLKKEVNQAQFDAMVSFAYNVGVAALAKSTLLRKVNADPCDPTIEAEFLRWNKAGGKVLPGLTRRRQEEANIYFQKNKS